MPVKRKLIKQGGSGLTMYVPKKWIEKKGLKSGDELDVEEINGGLLLSTEKVAERRETSIQLTGSVESSTATMIMNTYRLGFDIIHVSFKNKEQLKYIERTVRTRCIGFEITRKTEHSCTIESITEPAADQFAVILEKILHSITHMFEITLERAEGKEPFEHYDELEDRMQQYGNFCRRVIAKKQAIEGHAQLYWTFLTLINHAQRSIFLLNKWVLDKQKSALNEDILVYMKEALEFYQLFKKAYFKKEMKLLEQLHEQEKHLVGIRGHELLSTHPKQSEAVKYIIDSIRFTYLSVSPLMGMYVPTA